MFFQPKIISAIKNYSKSKLINDIVAGVIVAIIALPLSIALAIASGVGPERGLYTAIVAGFVIALFGGSNVNISGPTAAFATIVAGIVATQGFDGLVIATIMAGIILILLGVLKLGSLIKYIPYTITTGFTAGIAVTIVVGQIKDFLGLSFGEGVAPIETFEKLEAIVHSISTFNPLALVVGIVSVAILIVWPRLKYVNKVPGSLIVVILGSLVVGLCDLDVNTIGNQVSAGLPSFSFPEINMERIIALAPDAFTIAILAAIESLLSCVVSDGMINDKHNSNTELIAQGLGNISSGLFGGIPATGAIARTAANVKNGGRTPVAGIVHAIVLFLVLVVLMPLASWIPMPVIAAILFIVAYNMSEWRHFVHICKTASVGDIIVLVATFVLTVVFDLVVAIAAGLILTAFLFLKSMSDAASVRCALDGEIKDLPERTVFYEINGPMFFAATDKFLDFPRDDGVRAMIISAANVPLLDSSAIRNFEKLVRECERDGITLVLSHVNEAPLKALKKYGLVDSIGEENICSCTESAVKRAAEIVSACAD